MMKNIIAFILFIAIGISQTNLSIVSHFCSGQKVGTVVSWSEAHQFCTMDNACAHTNDTNDHIKPQRCCVNKIQSIYTDKSIASEQIITAIPSILFILPLLVSILDGFSLSQSSFTPHTLDSVPILTTSRQILFQSFLH